MEKFNSVFGRVWRNRNSHTRLAGVQVELPPGGQCIAYLTHQMHAAPCGK